MQNKLDNIKAKMTRMDRTSQENHIGEPVRSDPDCSSDELCIVDDHTNPDLFPPTLVVVQFHEEAKPAAIQWLCQKITANTKEGGAELMLRKEPEPASVEDFKGVTIHISASKLRLLESAELTEMKKRDVHGVLREFTVGDLDRFLPEGQSLDSFLTLAEKQSLVLHELENIRVPVASDEDITVPGYPHFVLYEGQSLFEMYVHEGFISQVFPLHDSEDLSRLGKKWYLALFQTQPFDDIRSYFGEAISLYFSFLGFYTTALVVPAILGLLQLIISVDTLHEVAFFCIFNLIWVTLFLEAWKWKCSSLAFVWGTKLNRVDLELPRANFRGPIGMDPVMGKPLPQYPVWKTRAKVYGVSLPIVFLSLFIAFWVMLLAFWAEEALLELKQRHGSRVAAYCGQLPSITYAIVVWMMNKTYRRLATFLTEWENHRTQSQFEKQRVTKLVLLEFVNNFMSLFYIAFYLQDMEMLRNQLAIMLIIQQAISHFQEALLPLVIRVGYRKFCIKKNLAWQKCRVLLQKKSPKLLELADQLIKTNKDKEKRPERRSSRKTPSPVGLGPGGTSSGPNLCVAPSGVRRKSVTFLLEDVPELSASDSRMEEVQEQAEMEPYEGTYDDYLEMFVQFGYVFLFSSVFPMAAFWAVVNNVLEIRADAFKLCRVYQRPWVKKVKDIGAWQPAFELLGALSVMTNCAILSLSPQIRSLAPNTSSVEWLLIFVGLEHIILVMKFALRFMIPDIPTWVKLEMSKLEYQSRQALKKERLSRSRQTLARKFHSCFVPRSKTTSSVPGVVQFRKHQQKEKHKYGSTSKIEEPRAN